MNGRATLKALGFRLIDLLGVNALFRHLNKGRIKVLLLHSITPGRADFSNALSPEELDAVIRHLKSHYAVIGITQSGAWTGYRSDRVNVLLSFDDGFQNNVDHALPVLQRHGVPALFFIISSCLAKGAPPSFVKAEERGAACFRTVTLEGARQLMRAGMTLGSHSMAHGDHSLMDEGEMIADASQSRATLEADLGVPVTLFAFPWGKHRPEQRALAASRYARIFLTEHGFCGPDDSIIPRNEVDSLTHARVAASGALDTLRRMVVP